MSGRPPFPRGARRLLEWVLPAALCSPVLGDLAEEAAALAAARGRARARIWLWRQAAALSLRFALERLRPGPRRGAPRHPRRKGDGLMMGWFRDLRFGARLLARNPGFAAVAVLTLAVGVGANTALFSVVHGVLLRPLPYDDPERLVMLYEANRSKGWDRFAVSPMNFRDWREQSTALEGIAALTSNRDTLTGMGPAEVIPSGLVSPGFFEVLGVEPLLGRTFLSPEEIAGGEQVVILGEGFWNRRLGADPSVLGRALTLGGRPYTVVGVVPEGVDLPGGAQLWRPFALDPADLPSRGARYVVALGKLRPGVTLEAAREEMGVIGSRLAESYPDANAGWAPVVVNLLEDTVADVRPALLLLLLAVGLVLLVACANVANLLLARATGRARELSVRNALGAGPLRLVRQLLTESLLLALLGGAAGIGVAAAGVRLLPLLAPEDLPRQHQVGLDPMVLLYALGLSVGTGILFGIAPAVRAARRNIAEALKGAGPGATAGGRRLRTTLVVGEMAVSLVLLVGAVLLGRSFVELTQADPGIRPEEVLTMRLQLPGGAYADDDRARAFHAALLERLQALPGVAAAGTVNLLPLSGRTWSHGVLVEGAAEGASAELPSSTYYNVSPGYFPAMGIELLRGRLFSEADRGDAPPVAVISAVFARTHFPGQDPLGRRVKILNGIDAYREVVGVVTDVKHGGVRQDAGPQIYEPLAQNPFRGLTLVVRANANPDALGGSIRREIAALDATLAPFSIMTMEQVVADSIARPRFAATLLGLFALVALVLSAVGLYGVVSYTVSQDTREIGVRMALGAPRSEIFRSVVGRGLRMALAGVALGLGGGVALGRLLSTALFGVSPSDPATFMLVSLTLVATAVLASFLPARKATRVDPIQALHCD